MAHDTIEIYVRELSEEEAAAWLRNRFDGVEQVETAPIVTYEVRYEGHVVPVQVTERVENGLYTSLWFNVPSAERPWDTATACARAAQEDLGSEVLCFLSDPEQPWTMLRVTDAGEEYVDKREVAL